MRYEPVVKAPGAQRVIPNLLDYEETCSSFSWNDAREMLDGLPGGGLNIAYECVDRHGRGQRRDELAIRWLGRHGEAQDFTFGDLALRTSEFAEVLDELGVACGSRVFTLLGRVPELYIAVLGALKHGSVACPLFSAFGPEPIRQRMSIGEGEVLVTTHALYRRKVLPIRDSLTSLRHVLLVGAHDEVFDGTYEFDEVTAGMPGRRECAQTRPDDLALLHFTSGTTGTPKGAMHVHDAVTAHDGHRKAGARPPPRRRLLVHCRSRLGHGNVVRDRRPARQRDHERGRRGRVRCRPLVRHSRSPARQRVVHGSDGGAHDDEGGGRGAHAHTPSPRFGSSPAWESP